MVGMGAGSVLALLSLVFALLKVDTWTRGYYSKRLFLGVPLAIIGGLLLVSLLMAGTMRGEFVPTATLEQSYSHSE